MVDKDASNQTFSMNKYLIENGHAAKKTRRINERIDISLNSKPVAASRRRATKRQNHCEGHSCRILDDIGHP